MLNPENIIPALVSLILFFAWWFLPFKRATSVFLLLWGLLRLFGGAIVSVKPFSFLPFYPEQSLTHYFFHAVYSRAQLPLSVFMISQFRQAH